MALAIAAVETTVGTDKQRETAPETHSGITDSADTVTTKTSAATVSPTHVGEGEDPSQAAVLIPERTIIDWVAYTVSLNYNRVRDERGSFSEVDKNIYLHPEVITFCQQVQEQEDNHILVRKPWPEIL
ncbi:hypothetical protein BGZ51_002388 [Haplosporangium sp. Z 767]|nr:hypothetical protein BGZ51_002388 [Haplosporangium sp. Z 767]